MARYAGQMALEGWGRQAQEKLKSSRIFLAGAGGVAGAAALHLLAAGLGALRLVDDRRITLADLSHPGLFRERDLGKPKAVVAEARLKEVNPFALVEGQIKALKEHNVFRLTSGYHLLLAASDAPAATLLNLAAARFRLALICAGARETEGRLTTFWPGRGPCLACTGEKASLSGKSSLMLSSAPSPLSPSLSPSLPPSLPPSLGPLPGIVGALMALEAMRILVGMGPGLLGRLLIFDARAFEFREEILRRRPRCPVCPEPAD